MRKVSYLAIKHGDRKLIEMLLKSNANINGSDRKLQKSVLYCAIKNDNITIAEELIKAGANIDKKKITKDEQSYILLQVIITKL